MLHIPRGCSPTDTPPLYHIKNFKKLLEYTSEGKTPTTVGSEVDSAAACQFSSDRCWAGSPIPCIELLIDLFLFLKQEGYCFLCCCLPLLPPFGSYYRKLLQQQLSLQILSIFQWKQQMYP